MLKRCSNAHVRIDPSEPNIAAGLSREIPGYCFVMAITHPINHAEAPPLSLLLLLLA